MLIKKSEIFDKKLEIKYKQFYSILKGSSHLNDIDINTFSLFIESYFFGTADNRYKIKRMQDLISIVNNIEIAFSKYLLDNDIKEQKKQQLKKTNEKRYTPTTAGLYISRKIGKKQPYSRAMVNNFIKQNKLIATKKGNRNYIYESDLNKFIEIYKDTLRVNS